MTNGSAARIPLTSIPETAFPEPLGSSQYLGSPASANS